MPLEHRILRCSVLSVRTAPGHSSDKATSRSPRSGEGHAPLYRLPSLVGGTLSDLRSGGPKIRPRTSDPRCQATGPGTLTFPGVRGKSRFVVALPGSPPHPGTLPTLLDALGRRSVGSGRWVRHPPSRSRAPRRGGLVGQSPTPRRGRARAGRTGYVRSGSVGCFAPRPGGLVVGLVARGRSAGLNFGFALALPGGSPTLECHVDSGRGRLHCPR